MSRVYIVTGKLGQGKTALCIDKIREYLWSARPVATNIDIRTHAIVGKDKKKTRVTRLPDHPTSFDIKALGRAYPGPYDENKTGALVLDECGTWLNAREWNASDRKELIDYLLHIRKKGWDVYLIIQDVSMLDKQVRTSLAEHVVYCKRTDRWRIPFITALLKYLTFGLSSKLAFKSHVGVVKLGTSPHGLSSENWWLLNAKPIYSYYDTNQYFQPDYPHGSYCQLPPYQIFKKSFAVKNWAFYMRLTKIYFRKTSKILAFIAGAILVTAVNLFLYQFKFLPEMNELKSASVASEADSSSAALPYDSLNMKFDSLNDLQITGFISGEDVGRFGFEYFFIDGQGRSYDTEYFYTRGVAVTFIDRCKAKVNYREDNKDYYVYCGVRNYEYENSQDKTAPGSVSLF